MTDTTTDPPLVTLQAPRDAVPHDRPTGRYYQPDDKGQVQAWDFEVPTLLAQGYTPLPEKKSKKAE